MGNVYNLLFRKGMTLKQLLVLLLFSGGMSFKVFSGNISFTGKKVYSSEEASRSASKYDAIQVSLAKYHVYELDRQAIYAYAMSTGYYPEFTLELGNEHKWDFRLEKNEIRRKDYIFRVMTEEGVKTLPRPETNTYKGIANDDPNIRVRMTISSSSFVGFIRITDKDYYIESAGTFIEGSNENHFIVYSPGDRINMEERICVTKTLSNDEMILDAYSSSSEQIQQSTCKEFDNANAADYSFVSAYGGVTGAEQHLNSILNIVSELYSPVEIEFFSSVTFFSDCSNCDPWSTTTNIVTLKDDSFTPWVNNGGFGSGAVWDGATLWTKRDVHGNGASGVIGFASFNSICKSNGTTVCEALGSNIDLHAVDQTHEYGHAFSCPHGSTNSSNVMSPSVSPSNKTWSSASINNINNYVGSISCLGPCTSEPVSDFSADRTSGCGSLAVKFTDMSTKAASWSWDFGDGNTSNQQNPTHTYSKPGNYTVSLTAVNEFGNNKETKTQFISVGTGKPYPISKGGPADNSMGTGASFTANDLRGLFFNAHEDVVIGSFLVYSGSAGTRTIEVLSNASVTGAEGQVTGTLLATKSVSIPAGESRVEVHIDVPAGNNYFIKLKGSVIDLYRNDTGPSYPYKITDGLGNNLVDITQSNANADAMVYYYYFYDWEVRKAGCQVGTGIAETEQDFIIYPNPVADVFHIELGAATKRLEVKLYNLTGEVVYEKSFGTASGMGMDKYQISLNGLSSGNYLLYVNAGDKVYSRKIMKQ